MERSVLSTYIEIPQHNVQFLLPPRLPFAHVLSSHSLRPEREELFRIFPHVGPVAGVEAKLFERGEHCWVRCCQQWTDYTKGKGERMPWRGIYVHIVPVRFRPRTMTFMGMVRVEGRVSTRRVFCWGDMLA